jgi:hypothetical protein
MTMQGEELGIRPSENYTVARVRRDVLANSDIGAIFVSRDAMGTSDDFNRVAGMDANFRFYRYFSLNGFAAKSETPGETRNQGTAKLAVGWEDSLKRLQASVMHIGEGFRDDLGFVRRTGVLRTFFDWAWMPQPESLQRKGIRQLQPHARVFTYYDPAGGSFLDRSRGVPDHLEQRLLVRAAYDRDQAIDAVWLRPDAPIPPGRYDWLQHLLAIGRTTAGASPPHGHRRRVLERNAGEHADQPALPAHQPVDVRRIQVSDIACRCRRAVLTLVNCARGGVAQHVPGCPGAALNGCEAVFRQHPLPPDSPSAE